MLAESRPVNRWLRPDTWLPTRSSGYYFTGKIKTLGNRVDDDDDNINNNVNEFSILKMWSFQFPM